MSLSYIIFSKVKANDRVYLKKYIPLVVLIVYPMNKFSKVFLGKDKKREQTVFTG